MPKDNSAESPPFGAYAPSGALALVVAATRKCSTGWLGKRVAFLLRGAAMRALRGRPVDIASLGARMRLYPYNNNAEKRLLFTPQYFDPRERALLAERLRGDFVFLDVGASVGGYALAVAANAGPRARILAVEPLPALFERLAYNIGQSGFANVKAVCCALSDIDGEVTLFVNAHNQGESSVRIVSAEALVERIQVRSKTLLTLAREEGYAQIDAIKLDIEGAEDLALDPFLSAAPRALWPRLIVMEFALLRVGAQLEQRLRRLGYREILRTGENVAYELGEEPAH
ncbi:MAG: FkbM family methyltransferase [Bradyrhizobium sp.]|nr:MAG: FkbM family methyltransferase [Bradyrhizobium sp.]